MIQQHSPEPWTLKVYDRFWGHVNNGLPDQCWEWSAGKFTQGYGVFHPDKFHTVKSHRFAFHAHYSIPWTDMPECVCHTCDNPSCCNPSHLFGGTRADNNLDKYAKGRNVDPQQGLGENNSFSKLKIWEVLLIRERLESGETQRRIAEDMEVSYSTVCYIGSNKRWSEFTPARISVCLEACQGISNEDLAAGVVTKNYSPRTQSILGGMDLDYSDGGTKCNHFVVGFRSAIRKIKERFILIPKPEAK